MINRAANAGQHCYSDDQYALSQTPASATEALLRVEPLPHWCWEPAAGKGSIVRVLRDAGHAVIASDLIDYGFPTHFSGRDFLAERKAPELCECIISNPPYRLAQQFVEHAITLVPLTVMLLPLKFLASIRRTGKLARIHIFRSSSIDHAWFVFAAHAGPIVVDRITAEKTVAT